MKTIAVIDDDTYIGNMLEEVLTREGYGVLRAYSGTEALLMLSREKPELVLLDLMLPGLTGEEVLPKIKSIPTIILSAKIDVEGKVNMLLEGAVDYITKPFDVKELLARIAVQLRRQTGQHSDRLRCGTIELDPLSHEVLTGGTEVRLTKTEYAILRTLMRHPNQVLAKSVILDSISEDTPDCMESSLKVHISNLRRKLREAGSEDNIEAIWGIGFRINDQS